VRSENGVVQPTWWTTSQRKMYEVGRTADPRVRGRRHQAAINLSENVWIVLHVRHRGIGRRRRKQKRRRKRRAAKRRRGDGIRLRQVRRPIRMTVQVPPVQPTTTTLTNNAYCLTHNIHDITLYYCNHGHIYHKGNKAKCL
jgi:hypothetical protein